MKKFNLISELCPIGILEKSLQKFQFQSHNNNLLHFYQFRLIANHQIPDLAQDILDNHICYFSQLSSMPIKFNPPKLNDKTQFSTQLIIKFQNYYFKSFKSRAKIIHLIFISCGQLQITKSQILTRIFLIITSAIGLFIRTLILQVINVFCCSPIGSRL